MDGFIFSFAFYFHFKLSEILNCYFQNFYTDSQILNKKKNKSKYS